MNLKNINKLLKHLERQKTTEFAARFNMRYWGDSINRFSGIEGMLEIPVCKTQACLAGETVLALKAGYVKENGGIDLNPEYAQFGSPNVSGIVDTAKTLLELNQGEYQRLFYFQDWASQGWPVKFQNQYNRAKTPNGRLAVAIRRLKHFIKTKGRE